jgi:hypothetical protein
MRLDTIDKPLVDDLVKATRELQRKAAMTACEIAINSTGLDIAVVDTCLDHLRHGHLLSAHPHAELERLIVDLDEQYFDLQHLDDALSLQMFGQARALSAVKFAGEAHSLLTISEAIYEASLATENGAYVLDAVRKILSES